MKASFLVGVILLGLAATLRPADAADVRMYVRHEGSDYAAWRKGYDAFNAERKSMGVKGAAVYQSVDNPNDVTVWHDFKTAEAAKAFASSQRLKDVMGKAGVKGTPQIWFTTQAKK
jgi:hypothetical protein